MSRIIPVHWKILECIFVKFGFEFKRHEGSHRSYVKHGINRPIIIPTYKSVDAEIIRSNMRTACMTRTKYFELLAKC